MRKLILALVLAAPTLSFAAGKMAPTKKALKAEIRSEMSDYTKVPMKRVASAKFQKFIADKANYTKLSLTPRGMQDASTTAFVAKNVYPGKVFVRRTSFMKSTWTAGDAPKN